METLLHKLPEEAKDARITLERALSGTALAGAQARIVAYGVLLSLGKREDADIFAKDLTDGERKIGKLAASLMGMTNVYYSFTHMAQEESLRAAPAGLRMQGYAQAAQMDKSAFELACLGVSMVSKCKPCTLSHMAEIRKLGMGDEQLLEVARIAASVHALAIWLD